MGRSGSWPELHSTFTGLAAYSDNLLLHLDGAVVPRVDWYEWAIDWTAAAGGHATGGHVGAFGVADWTDRERRERLWSGLRRTFDGLAVRTRAAGLDYLLVENLASAREPSTMAMIRDLMTTGDSARVPVRLCLDVGHMCVPGTTGDDRDPYAWLRPRSGRPGHPDPAVGRGRRPPLAVHADPQRRGSDRCRPGPRGAGPTVASHRPT